MKLVLTICAIGVGAVFLCGIGLVFMRMLGLSGIDISWLRGSVWFIVLLVLGVLGAILAMLIHKLSSKKTVANTAPTTSY